jgi:hypothetical protein
MTYTLARQEAQRLADKTGFDYGVESLGGSYRFFRLPKRKFRQGYELRCEVVSCTDLLRCAPGHGPVVTFAELP